MRFSLPPDLKAETAVTSKTLRRILRTLLGPKVSIFHDVHTHLPPWQMGPKQFLRGLDQMLIYHYIYRLLFPFRREIDRVEYFGKPVEEQADVAYSHLFLNGGDPLDEARLGVITTLAGWGLDCKAPDLKAFRRFFDSMDAETHVNRILEMAGVSSYTCTNNLFDSDELDYYQRFREGKVKWDPRAFGAMRIDTLVLQYTDVALPMLRNTFGVTGLDEEVSDTCAAAIRAFLIEWCRILPNVDYLGCSFPPDFDFMDQTSPSGKIMWKVILPVARELGLPLFMMPEPIRQLDKRTKLAGDYLGKMNPLSFARFAVANADVDFWVTPLNFSSQFEMSVLTGTATNVYLWGLWWYNLHETLANFILSMRIEMTGPNFLPVNSDARVLDQLFYKWTHFRRWFEEILVQKYKPLLRTGYPVTVGSICQTIGLMFDDGRMRRKRTLPPVILTA